MYLMALGVFWVSVKNELFNIDCGVIYAHIVVDMGVCWYSLQILDNMYVMANKCILIKKCIPIKTYGVHQEYIRQ